MRKDEKAQKETQKLMKAIGKNIKVRRSELGMTQEKLSELADINEKFLSSIENGKEGNISVGYLVSIAIGLDTTITSLIEN